MKDLTIAAEMPRAPRWRRAALAAAAVATLTLSGTALAVDTDCDGGEVDSGGFSCLLNGGTGFVPNVATVPGAQQVSDKKWSPKRGTTPQGDDSYFRVVLAGSQTFTWFGTTYNEVYIGSNGYVSLGTANTAPVNGASIPSAAAPNATIYAYGDDLDLSSAGTVWYAQSTCTVDRDGVGGNDACFLVRWESVPHKLGAGHVTVTVELALDLDTGEAFAEIVSETGSGAATSPRLVGTENAAGTDGLWFKSGADPDSRAASDSGASQFIFGFGDFIAPDPVALPTAASGDAVVTSEWNPSPSGDVAGVLVLRKQGAPVDAAPANGVSYAPGMVLGVGNVVACTTAVPATACTDGPLVNGLTYHYAAFAYDNSFNYSSGVVTKGLPRSGLLFKWAYTTAAATLAPPGVVAETYVVSSGNDGVVHRMAEADGTRGSWSPAPIGAPVQARPTVGDLAYPGTGDPTAYLAAQDGTLARVDLVTGAVDAARNALADAGCTGTLQSSPVVSLDAIDDNANPNDDRVVVTTRCPSSDNATLLYDHALAGVQDSFDNNKDLGMAAGSPRLHYVPGANTRVILPYRTVPNGPSLAVLELDGSGFGKPAWSLVPGLGDIDTTPALVRRDAATFYSIVGNTTGTVYVHDAMNRTGAAPAPLVELDSIATADGAVKGVVASSVFDAGAGAFSNWVSWSTDGMIHGARLGPGGTFVPGTEWSTAIPGPSSPVMLRFIGPLFRVYAGASDGLLYELDASTGTVLRSWLVEAGTTVGEPTFDFNDGVNQGLVVGTTGGLIVWVGL